MEARMEAIISESYRSQEPTDRSSRVVARSIEDLDPMIRELARYGTATVSIVLGSKQAPAGWPRHRAGSA